MRAFNLFELGIDKHWFSLSDSPEYLERKRTPFVVPNITIAEIRRAVPPELFKKSTFWGLYYVARALISAYVVYKLTLFIPLAAPYVGSVGVWVLWATYWWTQGLVLAGWWCLSHEAGHGGLTNSKWLNHILGFCLHTAILAPYYGWRESHRKHHKATMSVEREENFVPRTRSEYNLQSLTEEDEELEDGEQVGYLPAGRKVGTIDPHELFSDAPFYNLIRIVCMQSIGWQTYLFRNSMGNLKYPPGTANHFLPSSSLFKPKHRNGILISDIGLITMLFILGQWTRHAGIAAFLKVYFVPYILANHHIVLLTYLHHCGDLPYYRRNAWTFVRGALSTEDRPLYGWIGRAVLLNVSHDHVAHHLFSDIPFWNQPYVTECIKKVLQEKGEFGAYNYDRTNSFRALYRTFTQCCFIEDEGDVVFYKNRDGVPARQLAPMKS
ncbi:delta-12 fatty acid desaturase protein [Mucidula mucida]|nr:delta-12 fatty acid desaturase protein [Mucidula mucida]